MPPYRKRSLKERLKKYEKRRKFDDGQNLDTDMYKYLLSCIDVYNHGFDCQENQEAFGNNILEEIYGKEVHVSKSSVGSRVMDMILPMSGDKHILKFMYNISDDIMTLCGHPYASFVVQRLLIITAGRAQKSLKNSEVKVEVNDSENSLVEESDKSLADSDILRKMEKWFFYVSRQLVDNHKECIWKKFENHLLRTVLECLSGTASQDKKTKGTMKSKKSRQEETETTNVKPIPAYSAFLEEIGQTFLKSFVFEDMVYTDHTSALLQTLLKSLNIANKKLTKAFVRKLIEVCISPKPEAKDIANKEINESFSQSLLPDAFFHPCASRLLEVVIEVASKSSFRVISACCKNYLKELSQAPYANFCVQALFSHCREETEFEEMFDELSPHLELVLQKKYSGVILSMTQACERLGKKQNDLIKALMAALHCVKPHTGNDDFTLAIAQLIPYEECKSNSKLKEVKVTLHGALILQSMLRFRTNKKVVQSLLHISVDDLKALVCNPFGSYIIEAFIKSTSVGSTKHQQLVSQLQGTYVELACSKSGSRVLESLWDWAPVKYREIILKDLVQKDTLVNAHPIGTYIAHKFGLSLYKRRPQDWSQAQSQMIRKNKVFADIISNDTV